MKETNLFYYKIWVLGCFLGMALVSDVNEAFAQKFDDLDIVETQQEDVVTPVMSSPVIVPSPVAEAPVVSVPKVLPKDETTKNILERGVDKAKALVEKNETKTFVPRMDLPLNQRPTMDGVARGTVAVSRVYKQGEKQDMFEDKALIFLYYDKFKIYRSMTGRTSCSMRFYTLTNLDSKVINLSVKLVWPEISTTLAYIDVVPNAPTYFSYTLMGDGCYSMDKMPNIVVNRCRVKGLTSAQCAAKIKWIKKVN